MERAEGIGGFFFRAKDPQRMIDWYGEHLGIATMDQAGTGGVLQQEAGPTVFAPFVEDTDYFGRRSTTRRSSASSARSSRWSTPPDG
jgi:glyoxylase I family protein